MENENKKQSGCVNPYAPDKKAFSRIGFACLAVSAVSLALEYGLAYLIKNYYPDLISRSWLPYVLQVICLYIVSIPLGICIIRGEKQVLMIAPKPEKSSMSAYDFFISLIACFPLMYGGSLIGTILNNILSGFTGKTSDSGLTALFSIGPVWLVFLISVVIGPIMEEIFFRFALIEALRPWGWKAAMWISAGIFGIFHGNLEQLFYATFIGLIFGAMYLKTGKIRYSAAAHMILNFFGGFLPTLLTKDVIGDTELINYFQNLTHNPETEEEIKEFAEYLSRIAPYSVKILAYYGVILGLIVSGIIIIRIYRKDFRFLPGERQIERSAVGDTFFLAPGIMLFIVGSVALMIVNAIAA